MINMTLEEAKAWVAKNAGKLFIIFDEESNVIHSGEQGGRTVGVTLSSEQIDQIIADNSPSAMMIRSFVKHGKREDKNRYASKDTVIVTLSEGLNGLNSPESTRTFTINEQPSQTGQPHTIAKSAITHTPKNSTSMMYPNIPDFSDVGAYKYFLHELQQKIQSAEKQMTEIKTKYEACQKDLEKAKEDLRDQKHGQEVEKLNGMMSVKKDYLEMFMNSPLASAMGPAMAGTLDKLVDVAKPFIGQMAGAQGADPMMSIHTFQEFYIKQTEPVQQVLRDMLADLSVHGKFTDVTTRTFNNLLDQLV
jgi:hypothetical protein